MKELEWSKGFKKDFKRLQKRGKDLEKLVTLLDLLAAGAALPAKYKDHPLSGDWVGYRDAHIEPDWLLLYQTDADTVYLARTGTHADLFDE